jgi:hypothetical protein
MSDDISMPSGWNSVCEYNDPVGNYMLAPCLKCGQVHTTRFLQPQCNYCGKMESEVKILVAGPVQTQLKVHICRECIQVAVDLVRDFEPDFCRRDEDGITEVK